jgi:hypothetical protein
MFIFGEKNTPVFDKNQQHISSYQSILGNLKLHIYFKVQHGTC